MNEQTDHSTNQQMLECSSWKQFIEKRKSKEKKNEENNQFNSIFSFDEWAKQGFVIAVSPLPLHLLPKKIQMNAFECCAMLCRVTVMIMRKYFFSIFFYFLSFIALMRSYHPSNSHSTKHWNGKMALVPECVVMYWYFCVS